MTIKAFIYTAIGILVLAASQAQAGVRLTALQIISTDASGRIQGVGGHRFKTANHGGQPGIFVIQGDDLDGVIINGPTTAQNGIDIPLSAGTHTFTMYSEKYNSYTWTTYTLNLYFDQSMAQQVSALAPLNVNSTDFFPPISANQNFTEDLTGHSIQAPGTLVYKSGQTEVKLVSFHFSDPKLFNKDRVSSFEAKSNKVLDYVGQFTLEVTAPPEISAGGVVNGASFAAKVAPGSLFSIFGTDLATASASAQSLPLSTTLAGTSVTIGGKAAPLVFVSPGQINAQVPYEVLEGAFVPVIVTVNGVASAPQTVAVVPAAPGIFQFGQKRAVVQNGDYSVNTADNGAAADTYAVAYLTGSGEVDNVVGTGMPAAKSPLSRPRGTVSATVNGTPVEVVFAGLTPDLVGLMQVNFKVPNLTAGSYPLIVTVNGEKSNAAMITIK